MVFPLHFSKILQEQYHRELKNTGQDPEWHTYIYQSVSQIFLIYLFTFNTGNLLKKQSKLTVEFKLKKKKSVYNTY